MHNHQDAIESKLADTKVYLDKLQQEIGRTLEKISSREKYINNQVTILYMYMYSIHCTCMHVQCIYTYMYMYINRSRCYH